MKVNDVVAPVVIPSCGMATNEFQVPNFGNDYTNYYSSYVDQYSGKYYVTFIDPFGETIQVVFPSYPSGTESYDVISQFNTLIPGTCEINVTFTNSSLYYNSEHGHLVFVKSGSGFQILFCDVSMEDAYGGTDYNCKGNLVYN